MGDEMGNDETLAQLRQELDLVELAIANLQKLGRRRGRRGPEDLVAKRNQNDTAGTSS